MELLYIHDEPTRTLLVGLNGWPLESEGLALEIDGQQFAVADIKGWPDEDVAAWG